MNETIASAATPYTAKTATGRLPDFIMIGAMKSGTTTLHRHMSRHPRVFVSRPKEPQFFSRDHKYARGMSWYRSLFAEAGEEQVCGEASTCYSRWPHYGDVPGRIASHLPDVKLIYLMRHPVERAYSHYRHEMRIHRQRVVSFERALREYPEIFDASLYARQIEQYLRHFPLERMLLLTFDDLKENPQATMDRIHRFLGIEPVPLSAKASDRFGEADEDLANKRFIQFREALRRTPGWHRFVGLLPVPARRAMMARIRRVGTMQVWHRYAIHRHNRRLSPLTPDMRRHLLQRLEGPTRELEQIMDRDLSAWRE